MELQRISFDISGENRIYKPAKNSEAEKQKCDEEKRSDMSCFRELCREFPEVAFVVNSPDAENAGEEWLPERFQGISDTTNFSELNTVSIMLDIKLLEKAAEEPEFMEKLKMHLENVKNNYFSYCADCLSDGMTNMVIPVILSPDGRIGTGQTETKGRMYIGKDQEENVSVPGKEDAARKILKEYEKQSQEGLFRMMDKIHENSEELKEQIEKQEKKKWYLEKAEEYEKSFMFLESSAKEVKQSI